MLDAYPATRAGQQPAVLVVRHSKPDGIVQPAVTRGAAIDQSTSHHRDKRAGK
jgi:hypothetical protein